MSYTLGPRRGGGITDGAFAYLLDETDYRTIAANSHYAAFSTSERAAMCASLAFACILIVAAATALIMVVMRPWLKTDGKRRKTRLTTFIICLVLVIAGRATLIDDLVARLRGPQRYWNLYYFDGADFYGRQTVIAMFSWLSDILIFCLALVETTRNFGQAKRTGLEIANFTLIGILFVLAAAGWGFDVAWTWSRWGESIIPMPRGAIAGLSTAYATVAFLFSGGLMAILLQKSWEKSQSTLLFIFVAALCLGQALDLANTIVQEFSSNARAFTSALALTAIVDFIWAMKVLFLALLAWNSRKSILVNSAPGRGVQKASQSSSTGSSTP